MTIPSNSVFCDVLPTLSELIAECGENIAGLARDTMTNNWVAIGHNPYRRLVAKTPEEALANLYLALKKRSNAKQ